MGLSDAELGSDDNLADDVCGVQLGAVQRDRSASRGSDGAASTAASQRRVGTRVNAILACVANTAIRHHSPWIAQGSERMSEMASDLTIYLWSRLGSNQRPSACEADALPLSHGTGAERRTTSKISTSPASAVRATCTCRGRAIAYTRFVPRNLYVPAHVDYRRASHRATISSVARGCSAVGSASPCQGEGRGFESRHPLEGASGINPSGGVAEW